MALELEELRKELEDRLRDFSKKIESAWSGYRAADFGYAVKYLAEDIEDRIRRYVGGHVECYPAIDMVRDRILITAQCIVRRHRERINIDAETVYTASRDFTNIKLEDIHIAINRRAAF
jgi:hypothetical protein